MVASWPAGLPDSPMVNAYDETWPDMTHRDSPDNGIDMVRGNVTNAAWPLTVPLFMTKDQLALLQTFIYSTLDKGRLRFNWTHPRTGEIVDLRLVPSGDGMVKPKPEGSGLYWTATLQMEVLP
ncbi:MAG: hypothetical protein AB7E51_06760 [Pseudodesulfovibrio sp.]|uniref:hypothetical protein n=1 Tax=Pseudodesulfovibrio sp. TaxID=2035812 RepID=UPI003D0C975D